MVPPRPGGRRAHGLRHPAVPSCLRCCPVLDFCCLLAEAEAVFDADAELQRAPSFEELNKDETRCHAPCLLYLSYFKIRVRPLQLIFFFFFSFFGT